MKRILLLTLVFIFLGSAFISAQDCGYQIENTKHNNFVLIVDRSGSMSTGSALTYAMAGVGSFLSQVKSNDYISLISFSDDIKVENDFTVNAGEVFQQVKTLKAGGGTRLNDAIAKGIQMVSNREGRKVIVFLTDGVDNGSKFTVRNLEQMNIGEDIFLYGIGLGQVDDNILKRITSITEGTFESTPSPEELQNLYISVQNSYYNLNEKIADSGIYSIISVPSGNPVSLDGSVIGKTPFRLLNVEPGTHTIEVNFPLGIWDCTSNLKANYTSYVKASEMDLPNDLIIETAPTNAAVFIDDSYVGFSTMVPSHIGSVADQLRIRGLPPGKHIVRIVPAPDSGMLDDKAVEFEIIMAKEPKFIKVEVFFNKYSIINPSTGAVIEKHSTGGAFGSTFNFN
jgi:uncharacterized protein YegL